MALCVVEIADVGVVVVGDLPSRGVGHVEMELRKCGKKGEQVGDDVETINSVAGLSGWLGRDCRGYRGPRGPEGGFSIASADVEKSNDNEEMRWWESWRDGAGGKSCLFLRVAAVNDSIETLV